MPKLLNHRGVLATLITLVVGVMVLILSGPGPTVAQSNVGLEDPSAELQLLQAGDLASTGVDCNLQCATDQCIPGHQCGGTGSNCCCKPCGGQFGCYHSATCLGGS